MRIPKGFIKDSEGIYRRGNFVFRDNKIFRESAIVPKGTIEEVADNYTTVSECIRAILAFPASIGEKPRTTDIYVNKVGNNFKQSDKFTKDTVAIVTSDRNVIDIKAKDISDSTEFKDLISKDKPVKAKEIRRFSSDKPKDSQEVIRAGLKESESSIVQVDVYTDASDENGIIQELRTNSNPVPQEIGIKVLNEHGPAGGNPEILLIGDLNVIKNWLHTELFDDDMYKIVKESAEDIEKFWNKGFKVGDKVQSSGAGEIEILDLNKGADYALIKRNTSYEPFVACWAPSLADDGKIYWGQGHYFDDENDAREYFNSRLNESENNLKEVIRTGLEMKDYLKLNGFESLVNKIDDDKATYRLYLDPVKGTFSGNYKLEKINESEKLNKSKDGYIDIKLGFQYDVKSLDDLPKEADIRKDYKGIKCSIPKVNVLRVKGPKEILKKIVEDSDFDKGDIPKIKDLNESVEKRSIKEGEYEDIYGEATDFTDMRKFITALREICDKAEVDGFNFVGKFEKAINDLTDVCFDIEDFYENNKI